MIRPDLTLPIPDDMDGKVLIDLFKNEFVKENEIISEKAEEKQPSDPDHTTLGETEQQELEDKLKGLGYLD